MENTNVTSLPEILPKETDVEYVTRCTAAIGSYQFFTIVRDQIIAEGKALQRIAASRELTPQEKQNARDLHTQLVVQQCAVDAAWKFENMTSDGMAVN